MLGFLRQVDLCDLEGGPTQASRPRPLKYAMVMLPRNYLPWEKLRSSPPRTPPSRPRPTLHLLRPPVRLDGPSPPGETEGRTGRAEHNVDEGVGVDVMDIARPNVVGALPGPRRPTDVPPCGLLMVGGRGADTPLTLTIPARGRWWSRGGGLTGNTDPVGEGVTLRSVASRGE